MLVPYSTTFCHFNNEMSLLVVCGWIITILHAWLYPRSYLLHVQCIILAERERERRIRWKENMHTALSL